MHLENCGLNFSCHKGIRNPATKKRLVEKIHKYVCRAEITNRHSFCIQHVIKYMQSFELHINLVLFTAIEMGVTYSICFTWGY